MPYYLFEFNNGTYDGEVVLEAESPEAAQQQLVDGWDEVVDQIVYWPGEHWSKPEQCIDGPSYEVDEARFLEHLDQAGEVLPDSESQRVIRTLEDRCDHLLRSVQAAEREAEELRAVVLRLRDEGQGHYDRAVALADALERIAHAHDEHGALHARAAAQTPAQAWSDTLGWAQDIAKAALVDQPLPPSASKGTPFEQPFE